MKTNRSATPSKQYAGAPIWTILLLLTMHVSSAPGQDRKDPDLQRVYRQMDERAKSFRSFTAKVVQKEYTAVLKEFGAPETGEFHYQRDKAGASLLRLEFISPGRKILTIKDNIATLCRPDIKQAQIKNLGKDQDLAEYLAIGLSQSPAKLEKTFDITYKGSEILGGAPCDVLVFKPRLPKIAAYFSLMTVWYKKSNGIPIQNKKEEPNGNYVLIRFTDEKLNGNIPSSKFDQNLSGMDIQKF